MEREGQFAPETVAEAEAAFDAVGPAAQTVVRETARAMEFDREEYDERVTGEVVESARNALFAALLTVSIGDRAEFEEWRDSVDREVIVAGSDAVDRVVWHDAPAVGAAVAATFADEREAAAATLRRQAFGRIYQPLLVEDADPEELPVDQGPIDAPGT